MQSTLALILTRMQVDSTDNENDTVDSSHLDSDVFTADAVVFDEVGFAYPSSSAAAPGRPALDGVSFRIAQGEFCCVLGANGSGKSTLAQHIDALLTCASGRVDVLGLDASVPENARQIRQGVGLVFQNPDDQSLAPTVARDVAFGPENLGLNPSEIESRVSKALAAVGISGLADEEVSRLSGGQRQRVAIAGALALQPQILVLDEPATMLDPRGRQELMQLLGHLNAQGLCIVLITHFMDDIASAGHVLVMDGGRLAFDGTPEELVASPKKVEELGLELPFSYRVSLELNKRGIEVAPTLDARELEAELCRSYSTR